MPSQRIALLSLALALGACKNSADSATPEPAETGTSGELRVEVFTAPDPAGAVNSTIVFGESMALVIDAQYTKSGATAVADAIEAEGKTLSHVLITHAHPDHYFGAVTLKERFPQARVVAVPAVVEQMEATAAAKAAAQSGQLGDEFPGEPVIPEPLDGETLSFEGHELPLLIGLQGDTDPITGVVIPEAQTAVLSDVLFSGVHVWTADSTHDSRVAWMAQLDELHELHDVTRFIPGHQAPKADQSAEALRYTRGYLEAFDRSAAEGTPSTAIIETMQGEYPDAGGAFFLQLGAKVAAGEMKWQ